MTPRLPAGFFVFGTREHHRNGTKMPMSLSGHFYVDSGTYVEQNAYITDKEHDMTEILRDVAAFASIAMFIASLSMIAMAL